MEPVHQRLLRQVIKRVHPDLFLAHPFEMKVNSESLQALNAYADQLAAGVAPRPAALEFYVHAGPGGGMAQVTASLSPAGDLLPLFSAFGLGEEARAARSSQGTDAAPGPGSLVGWLRASLADAARLAGEHRALTTACQELRAAVERAYDLAHLQMVNEYPLSMAELRGNLAALRGLEAALCTLCADDPDRFQGLSLRVEALHAGGTCANGCNNGPSGDASRTGGGSVGTWAAADGDSLQTPACHISDEGVVRVPAGVATEALADLDAGRARLLGRVANFWRRRAWDLETPLATALSVRSVACYGNDLASYQAFVLWGGAVLRMAGAVGCATGDGNDDVVEQTSAYNGATPPPPPTNSNRPRHAFGILVHSADTGPVIDPVPGSAFVQVRACCSPEVLLEYLASGDGASADAAALAADMARAAEAAALEAARAALGLRGLLRLCAGTEAAADAAKRLCVAAPTLRAALPGLSDVTIALDDGYRVWESGLLSIPHDFGGAKELDRPDDGRK